MLRHSGQRTPSSARSGVAALRIRCTLLQSPGPAASVPQLGQRTPCSGKPCRVTGWKSGRRLAMGFCLTILRTRSKKTTGRLRTRTIFASVLYMRDKDAVTHAEVNDFSYQARKWVCHFGHRLYCTEPSWGFLDLPLIAGATIILVIRCRTLHPLVPIGG